MLYIASIPGFVLILGMQFAVDSPRWLCKVGFFFIFPCKTFENLVSWYLIQRWHILSVQVGRTDDAKEIVRNLWGASEVEKAIDEFQAVIKNDGSDAESRWLELLEEPHSRGCTKVDFRFQVLIALPWLNLSFLSSPI